MKCDRCHKEDLPDSSANYEVRGYEHARAEGGTNHIQARRRTGRVICNGCLVEVKSKIHKGQMRMSV
jgi:hypothetical protein